jgi:hypothetical protein
LLHLFEAPKGLTADNAALCFDANGRRLAYSSGTQAKLWDVASGKELESWDLPAGLVDQLAFHPDGKLLLFRVETHDSQPAFGNFPWKAHPRVCRLRNLTAGGKSELLAKLEEFNRRVLSAAMPADGSYVVVEGLGGPDGKRHIIKIFEPLTGKELAALPANRKEPHAALLSLDPTGKVLGFQPNETGEMVLLQLPAREPVGALEHLSMSPGPRAELTGQGNDDGSFSLVRWNDKARLFTLAAGTLSPPGPFTSTGTYWTWGQYDGTVVVCDLNATRRRLAEIGLGWKN